MKIFKKTIEMMAREAFDVINNQDCVYTSVVFNFERMDFSLCAVEPSYIERDNQRKRRNEEIVLGTCFLDNMTEDEWVEIVVNRVENNSYYEVL